MTFLELGFSQEEDRKLSKGFGSVWYGKNIPKITAGEKIKSRFLGKRILGQDVVTDNSLPENTVRFIATVEGKHSNETYDVTL